MGKKTRETNQTIRELFEEYIFQLDEHINSFAMRYGYFPKDPEGFDYPFCPPEVQDMSFKFWNEPHITKLDCLATMLEKVGNL